MHPISERVKIWGRVDTVVVRAPQVLDDKLLFCPRAQVKLMDKLPSSIAEWRKTKHSSPPPEAALQIGLADNFRTTGQVD
eukprot:1878436-Amphidinium_carterae.1